MTILAPVQQSRAFLWVVLVLALAAVATLSSLWVPLVLAAWGAAIARPLLLRVSRAIGGRGRAAAFLVVGLVVALALPFVIIVISVSRGIAALATNLMSSSGAKGALVALVSGDGGGAGADGGPLDALKSPQKIVALVQEHGAQAFHILGGLAGAATGAVIGLLIFLYATYVFLVDGPGYYDWVEKHAPIEPSHTQRLAAAFHETGRGLFIGVGLTGLVQGTCATIAYLALGVPRALVLGLLTCLVSVIPSVGTALVWVPVAAGLALAGKTTAAAILVGVGVVIIGSVDNLLRPVFARFGKLELPSLVLLISIFGGLSLVGTWGFLLGPLVVRLAKEAFVCARHDRLAQKRAEVDALEETPDVGPAVDANIGPPGDLEESPA